MAGIFISYRAADTGPYANLLARSLREKFGLNTVFRDRNEIDLGDQFVEEILKELGRCEVALVLIGANWTTVAGSDGKPRLYEPADLVHREVALALELRRIVVPVLLDGAPMPTADQLPEKLRGLVWLDRYDFSGKYFERDAADLSHRIEVVLAKAAGAAPRGPSLTRQFQGIWIALALLALALSVAPAFSSLIQRQLWLFPGAMSATTFFWWLYLLVHTREGGLA